MNDPDQQQIPTADGVPVHCAHTAIVPLDTLRPYPRNAKQHPADQIAALAKLIRHHGWRYPITISNQSGYIVRGHARREAAERIIPPATPYRSQRWWWTDIRDEEERARAAAEREAREEQAQREQDAAERSHWLARAAAADAAGDDEEADICRAAAGE